MRELERENETTTCAKPERYEAIHSGFRLHSSPSFIYVSYLHMSTHSILISQSALARSSLQALLDRTFSFSLHKTPSREASDQWKPVCRPILISCVRVASHSARVCRISLQEVRDSLREKFRFLKSTFSGNSVKFEAFSLFCYHFEVIMSVEWNVVIL